MDNTMRRFSSRPSGVAVVGVVVAAVELDVELSTLALELVVADVEVVVLCDTVDASVAVALVVAVFVALVVVVASVVVVGALVVVVVALAEIIPFSRCLVLALVCKINLVINSRYLVA